MRSSGDAKAAAVPIALAIGQYDGVHLGHQAVFRAAVEAARACRGVADCLTFHPHVAQLLNPGKAPLLLGTPEQNQAWIGACGIRQVHVIPFTREFAAMSPDAFLTLLKLEFPGLAVIVVGWNFTFGKDRAGNADTLPGITRKLDLQARIVPPVNSGGAPISSTRIRAAVTSGDLPQAKAMLGRPFGLAGQVVRGRAVGRTLGFPTANVRPILAIRPAPGIYAARLVLPEGPLPGAAFVPDPADPAQAHFGDVVEIHVSGLGRELYGCDVEVTFTRRLRGYMPFPDPASASAQIARDTEEALQVDAQENP
jgi:riboflavin kinase/FMN adenylyltransferase